jgi:phospholipid/cholesterol/gamma-HCH transport system permease protein
MLTKVFRITGEYTLFTIATLTTVSFIYKRRIEIINQLKKIGYNSIILIAVTSAFTGLVTALQAAFQTRGFIPQSLIGVMAQKAIMAELAPTLTALVLSGKIGASIAAEIGSMKVTEQLDALQTMSVNPHNYLFLPRLLAGLVMLPILTLLSMVVAIFSAFFFSNLILDVSASSFFINMRAFFNPLDLWIGIIKAFVFGFIIVSTANFIGSRTTGGAEGVGVATTNTVVFSCIGILVTNFVITQVIIG